MRHLLKIPGNSGCELQVIADAESGRMAVRKSATSPTYARRLARQREKQRAYTTGVGAITVPKVLSHDDSSFTMEYLPMVDAIEFLEIARPEDLRQRIEDLLALVSEELAEARPTAVDGSVFRAKLEAIHEAVGDEAWHTWYSSHAERLGDALPETLTLPMGRCHGDLTFANIMFSLRGREIGLIDFLDGFLESPVFDVVKLRQDTRFGWTRSRKQPHDSAKVALVMDWVDGLLTERFEDVIREPVFHILERVNYLRMAPYARSPADHGYLDRVLRTLSTDRST